MMLLWKNNPINKSLNKKVSKAINKAIYKAINKALIQHPIINNVRAFVDTMRVRSTPG